MTAQHTPGPWEVDLCDNGAFAVYVPPAVDMGWMTVITSRGQLPDRAAESHANARLIAAAPGLLEALQAAVECGMVPTSSAAEGGASKHSRQVQVADMIRAAIARATHKEGA